MDKEFPLLIRKVSARCCCEYMNSVDALLRLELNLDSPAYIIKHGDRYAIIGQCCPMCGNEITERSDNDGSQ